MYILFVLKELVEEVRTSVLWQRYSSVKCYYTSCEVSIVLHFHLIDDDRSLTINVYLHSLLEWLRCDYCDRFFLHPLW